MPSAERSRGNHEGTIFSETQQKLFQELWNSGLRFYNMLTFQEPYSQVRDFRKLGDTGVKKDVVWGYCCLAFLSSGTYPFGKGGLPSYDKSVEWSFGMTDGEREGILGRRVRIPDQTAFRVILKGHPDIGDEMEFKLEPNNWQLKSHQRLGAREPLGRIRGEEQDRVAEEIIFSGEITGGPISLKILRTVVGSFFIRASATYGNKEGEGLEQGIMLPQHTDVETALYDESPQKLKDHPLEEIGIVEGRLLGTFPRDVVGWDLLSRKLGIIQEATDQAVGDLRKLAFAPTLSTARL